MTISNNLIQNIHTAIHKYYGDDFKIIFSDEEIRNIALLVLEGLVESLKVEIVNPELPTIDA